MAGDGERNYVTDRPTDMQTGKVLAVSTDKQCALQLNVCRIKKRLHDRQHNIDVHEALRPGSSCIMTSEYHVTMEANP